jgi:hypothetical protein
VAKALRTVGKVAGVVSTIASFIPGGQGIAVVAGAVSAVSNVGSQILAKPPPPRGSISQILVETNPPQPYVMGEGYFAGVLRHDAGYGATLKKVPNPYRVIVVVCSGGGPVQSITPKVEFANVSSWYSGFLYTDTQLGATPETSALSPHFGGMPGWGSSYKLSGQAAILWNLKFDRDGKRFASGVPVLGAEGRWVKVYDPRKDSTFPGGSGAHRLGNEATYEWSENPALHAGTYAFGRYQNGKRTIGMGLPADGIDWQVIAAWANVCDANSWTMFGVVYEPGDRWANLKDICFAGGGEPVAGGKLTFRYSAPVVALDTITEADLTDGPRSVTPMQSFRDRINTAIPKYRSPAHNWELVDGEAVSIPTFLAEDGEEKRETWPFNFVKKPGQAAQLATYRIWDSREIAPVQLVCKPRLRAYRPGECLELDLPDMSLSGKFIILRRQLDPASMTVTLELMGETSAKHAYCLGQTATPPPTPALQQTPQQKDEVAAALYGGTTLNPRGSYSDTATYNPDDLAVWLSAEGGDGKTYYRVGEGPTTGVDPSDASVWALFIEGGAGSNGLTTGRLTIYRRISSTPALPSTSATFNIETGILTGQNNDWAVGEPVQDPQSPLPLFLADVYYATAGTSVTIEPGDWVGPRRTGGRIGGFDTIDFSRTDIFDNKNLGAIDADADIKLGDIEVGATKTRVFRQTTAPSSPNNGDTWVDISQVPNVTRVRVGGSWQIAANYITGTGQISDDAGLGNTAVWSSVGGRPTNLSDLDNPRAVKIDGVAGGATRNRVYRQTGAPGGAGEGDFWLDGPVTKVRQSGAWRDAANYTTATSELTDDAGLGNRANWSGVQGKPAEIEDGRIAAGLDPSGNVSRPLPAVIKTQSDILSRGGGGTFTGDTDAQRNSRITISNGAISGIGSGSGAEVANERLRIAFDTGGTGGFARAVLRRNAGAIDVDTADLPGIVQNQQIGVDGNGLIQGIGQGLGTRVANSKITASDAYASNLLRRANGGGDYTGELDAERTTGKSLSLLTDRTADNIAESAARKWAAESGADFSPNNSQTWTRTYTVKVDDNDPLRGPDGDLVPTSPTGTGQGTRLLVSAVTLGTGTDSETNALFRWTGSSWALTQISNKGQGSNHPVFQISNGEPRLRTSHPNYYTVRVTHTYLNQAPILPWEELGRRPNEPVDAIDRGARLTIPGSGQTLNSQRNLPPIAAMNLRYKNTVPLTVSNITQTSATVSRAAGAVLLGSQSLSYNAASRVISGSAGEAKNLFGYFIEDTNSQNWGGAKTLHLTEDGNAIYSDDRIVWLGSARVTFADSGGGGGSGGGTGGGGGGNSGGDLTPPPGGGNPNWNEP